METIEISSISTTNTSEYKFLSLPRSESEDLGKVYPSTKGGMLSPGLMVVPLILIAALLLWVEELRPLAYLETESKD